MTARAARAGVKLLIATDTTTCRQPGWSSLEEIVLLGRAGVPAIDVLRAATINAATVVGMQAQVGTVTRGKLADLVLLDGDPLVDISNVNRINAVVADGRLFDEAGRKQLLDDVLANARATGATTTSAQR
jgi:imidazolonepropionase-like amidohydrolase